MRVPYAELRRLLRDALQLQRIRARDDDREPLYVEIEATSPIVCASQRKRQAHFRSGSISVGTDEPQRPPRRVG
jgi:hypothetical protein